MHCQTVLRIQYFGLWTQNRTDKSGFNLMNSINDFTTFICFRLGWMDSFWSEKRFPCRYSQSYSHARTHARTHVKLLFVNLWAMWCKSWHVYSLTKNSMFQHWTLQAKSFQNVVFHLNQVCWQGVRGGCVESTYEITKFIRLYSNEIRIVLHTLPFIRITSTARVKCVCACCNKRNVHCYTVAHTLSLFEYFANRDIRYNYSPSSFWLLRLHMCIVYSVLYKLCRIQEIANDGTFWTNRSE